MLTHDQVVVKLLDWARVTLPTLQGGYSYVPAAKTANLPDVVCEVNTSLVTDSDPDFPWEDIQQTWIMVYRCQLSFMVDNGDPKAAAEQLRGFADALRVEALKDRTLGSRVPARSARFSFTWSPPFVEYEDGTKGREMSLELAIADPIEVET